MVTMAVPSSVSTLEIRKDERIEAPLELQHQREKIAYAIQEDGACVCSGR